MVTDIIGEACIGVGAAICAILNAFQAAQHRAFNARNINSDDSVMLYQDVGSDVALAILLGLLMVSSFGVMALSLIELNRHRGSMLEPKHRGGKPAAYVGV